MNASVVRAWIWIATAVVAALWTLLVWGAHALVAATGDLLINGIGQLDAWPEIEQLLAPLAGWIEPLGQFAIVAVWALGLGVLSLLAWAGQRLTRIAQRHGHAQ